MDKFFANKKTVWSVFAIFFLVCEYAAISNATFEEWDGVAQLYAGLFLRSDHMYSGWGSHFWPPLFSLLLGGVYALKPVVAALRQVSIVAALVMLILFYRFLIRTKLLDAKFAFLALVLVASQWVFLASAVQAENHMLDTAFFVGALGCLFVYHLNNRFFYAMLAGVGAGLACNTRYTSYILVFAPLLYCLLFGKFDRRLLLGFFAPLFVICAPWWYQNYKSNGFFLHTWQYQNIGYGIFENGTDNWWWIKQRDYHSIGDIIRAAPFPYIKNFLRNSFRAVKLTTIASGGLAIFAAYGVFRFRKFFDPAETRWVGLIVMLYLGFVALVAQAFVFDQVFLSWGVLFALLGLLVLSKMQRQEIFIALLLWVSVTSAFSFRKLHHWTHDTTDSGQLAAQQQVNEMLLRNGWCKKNDVDSCRIIAEHPSRALSLGVAYSMLPIGPGLGVADVLHYQSLPEDIVAYAPKWPFGAYHHVGHEVFIVNRDSTNRNSPWASAVNIENCPEGLRCEQIGNILVMVR